MSELSFVCAVQLSEYELDREQRVKRNHILMGDLVRAILFLSFKSFGFADCGVLFREFQSWFSSSTQSSRKLNQTGAARMKQLRLITYFGGGETISTLIFSWILNSEYSLRVSDSLNIFARSDLWAQFRVYDILSV